MLPDAFTPEAELPPGVGFSHFGPGHLAVLGILAALSAGVVVLGCRVSPRGRRRLLGAMAGTMVLMEAGKLLTLYALGVRLVGYLPLHLCSLGMLICIWGALRPGSDGAGQLLWSVCFAGGLGALLFPDWTDMPLWHFQSVHSFLYHAMLVQFALIAVISGQARPRLRGLWKAGLFLLIAAVPVGLLNRALGTNYMFLSRPVPGTPLEICARLPGVWGYRLGLGLLAAAVMALLDLPFPVLERLRGGKCVSSGDRRRKNRGTQPHSL